MLLTPVKYFARIIDSVTSSDVGFDDKCSEESTAITENHLTG